MVNCIVAQGHPRCQGPNEKAASLKGDGLAENGYFFSLSSFSSVAMRTQVHSSVAACSSSVRLG